MFMFIGQALLVGSMWSVGVPVAQTQVLMIFNYFVVAGVVAMTVDIRMVPTAIGYGVMFGLATLHPDLRLYFMGAGNFILMLNSYYSWVHRAK